jgi:hypothetical protein
MPGAPVIDAAEPIVQGPAAAYPITHQAGPTVADTPRQAEGATMDLGAVEYVP